MQAILAFCASALAKCSSVMAIRVVVPANQVLPAGPEITSQPENHFQMTKAKFFANKVSRSLFKFFSKGK